MPKITKAIEITEPIRATYGLGLFAVNASRRGDKFDVSVHMGPSKTVTGEIGTEYELKAFIVELAKYKNSNAITGKTEND